MIVLFNLPLSAQVLTGYVYDNETKEPIYNANVFLEQTSYYSITDEKGYFHIKLDKPINTRLIISHLIYNTITFDNPFESLPKEIFMTEKFNELEEVTIQSRSRGGRFSWNRKMGAFRQLFLGKTVAGKSCRIMNEEDIDLLYNSETKILSARSNNPIIVENKYLGYRLHIELEKFEVWYKDNSLLETSVSFLDYYVRPLFIDTSSGTVRIEKRRKEVYEYGMNHFFKCLINDDLKNYSFLKNSGFLNADDCFTVADTLSVKKARINSILAGYKETELYSRPVLGSVEVLFKGNKSELIFFTDTFYVDSYGRIIPTENLEQGILFRGFLSDLRVGDWLPLDYEPAPARR